MKYGVEEAYSEIHSVLRLEEDREAKAQQLANIFRGLGPYRWVGIYDVGPELVTNLAWSGHGPPEIPDFPVKEGLTSAAIAQKKTIVVGDVTGDARHLAAFDSTRSEMIVPVLCPKSGNVIGTIDVECDRVNGFSEADRLALEDCVRAALPFWLPECA